MVFSIVRYFGSLFSQKEDYRKKLRNGGRRAKRNVSFGKRRNRSRTTNKSNNRQIKRLKPTKYRSMNVVNGPKTGMGFWQSFWGSKSTDRSPGVSREEKRRRSRKQTVVSASQKNGATSRRNTVRGIASKYKLRRQSVRRTYSLRKRTPKSSNICKTRVRSPQSRSTYKLKNNRVLRSRKPRIITRDDKEDKYRGQGRRKLRRLIAAIRHLPDDSPRSPLRKNTPKRNDASQDTKLKTLHLPRSGVTGLRQIGGKVAGVKPIHRHERSKEESEKSNDDDNVDDGDDDNDDYGSEHQDSPRLHRSHVKNSCETETPEDGMEAKVNKRKHRGPNYDEKSKTRKDCHKERLASRRFRRSRANKLRETSASGIREKSKKRRREKSKERNKKPGDKRKERLGRAFQKRIRRQTKRSQTMVKAASRVDLRKPNYDKLIKHRRRRDKTRKEKRR